MIRAPDAKEKFLNISVEPITAMPEEFAAKIKSEMARWGKVIKEAGIKAD